MRRIHLLSERTGVIHVVIAEISAQGENMNTSIEEENGSAQAPAAGEKPKRAKKARVAPPGAHVAKKKGKSAHKASPAKKAPKGAKKATGARDGSKTNKVLELLKRPGGVTAKELMKVHRMAGAFCPRLPLRDSGEENGTDGHIHQERRRGAQLLDQSLKPVCFAAYAPSGSKPAAFLVL